MVVGTVVVLLVAVAIDDTTRDVDGKVTSTRDAFVNMGTFLEDVVALVTCLVEVGDRSPSQDVPS